MGFFICANKKNNKKLFLPRFSYKNIKYFPYLTIYVTEKETSTTNIIHLYFPCFFKHIGKYIYPKHNIPRINVSTILRTYKTIPTGCSKHMCAINVTTDVAKIFPILKDLKKLSFWDGGCGT